jgi:hypothetical protein
MFFFQKDISKNNNFDDIFILNLLKLLHLRKIKPITSSENMFCSVDWRKMEYYDFCLVVNLYVLFIQIAYYTHMGQAITIQKHANI